MRKSSKVAVVALNLCRPMTGVGRYISEVSKLSNNFEMLAITPNKNIVIKHEFKFIKSFNYFSKFGKLFFSLFSFGIGKEYIIHFPQPLISLFEFKRTKIVTIHDLLFIELKEYYPLHQRIILNLFTWFSVKMADHIICVSYYTKNKLVEYYGRKANISVVYNCVDIDLRNRVNFKRPINDEYLLIVSNRTPRKNLKTTIEAFKHSKYCNANYKLVICGPLDGDIKLNPHKNILDLGYVSDVELLTLYTYAKAQLFFSLGEGFGYPIIEAAICGTPTYASNNTSISELFDYNKKLLCDNYSSKEGIVKFLDSTFDNSKIDLRILNCLKKKLHLYSKKNFNFEMKNIYGKYI